MGIGVSKTVSTFETEVTEIKKKLIDYLGVFYDDNDEFHLKNGIPDLEILTNLLEPSFCDNTTILLKNELNKMTSEFNVHIAGKDYLGYAVPQRSLDSYIGYNNDDNKIKKEEVCKKISTHYIKIMNLLAAVSATISHPKENLCEYLFFRLFNDKTNTSDICSPYKFETVASIPGINTFIKLLNFTEQDDLNLLISKESANKIIKLRQNILDHFEINLSNWSTVNIIDEKKGGGRKRSKKQKYRNIISRKKKNKMKGGSSIPINEFGTIIDTNITDNKGKSRVYLNKIDPSIYTKLPIKQDDIEEKCAQFRLDPNIFRNNELILDTAKLGNKHFSEFDKQIKKMKDNYIKNAKSLLTIVESIIKREEISIKNSVEEEKPNLNNSKSSSILDTHKISTDNRKKFIYTLKPITELQLDNFIITSSENISNLFKGCHKDYKDCVRKLIIGYESFISAIKTENKKPS